MSRFPQESGISYRTIGSRLYRTEHDHHFQTGILLAAPVVSQAAGIKLHADGWIEIMAGYVYDGSSGPTIQTADSMRGALGHDAGYDLLKLGLLAMEHREALDKLLLRLCLEDGMLEGRAEVWYAAVRQFGEQYMNRREPAAVRRERRDR